MRDVDTSNMQMSWRSATESTVNGII